MTIKNIQKEIEILERMIADDEEDLDYLKQKLQRLKFLAFEEEFIEEDNRKLLQG